MPVPRRHLTRLLDHIAQIKREETGNTFRRDSRPLPFESMI